MAFPFKRQQHKNNKTKKLKELKQKLASVKPIQQKTMCVFVMLKFLRDEIAAFYILAYQTP